MPKTAISADDKRWQAEDDARSLKRYAEISDDKTRMAAANKVLKDEAAATNKALGLTGSKSTNGTKPKTPTKKNTDNIRNAMMSGMSKGKK